MRSRIRSSVACSSGGRNSCSGGSSSRIVTGSPLHRLEDALEVGLLHRQELGQRGAALDLVGGHDHLADDREPVLRHEHVLGAAEADPFGAELACLTRVGRRVRVRVHSQPANLVGPIEDRLEVVVPAWRRERDAPDDHAAGRAVDRDLLAFCDLAAADRRHPPLQIDREALDARQRRACPCRARRRRRGRSCRRARSRSPAPASARECRRRPSPSGRG